MYCSKKRFISSEEVVKTKMAKDNFSAQSKSYASFRPVFPDALYKFIISNVNEFDLVWDVATGNGQSAIKLAPYFKNVFATDISNNQLDHATQLPNVVYKNEPAEHSTLADQSVNLISISQAIHWFQFDTFYKEVKRVAKQGAIIAAFCYSILNIENEKLNNLLASFYTESQPYWDNERKYIDEKYQTIPFPFEEIAVPGFSMQYEWSMHQLIGYLETWSANQHYLKLFGTSLVNNDFKKLLSEYWPTKETLCVQFPVSMRIGRIK